jgi:hypothetical protein
VKSLNPPPFHQNVLNCRGKIVATTEHLSALSDIALTAVVQIQRQIVLGQEVRAVLLRSAGVPARTAACSLLHIKFI